MKSNNKRLFIGDLDILVSMCPASLIIIVTFITLEVKYFGSDSVIANVISAIFFSIMTLVLIIVNAFALLKNCRTATLTEQGIFFYELFTPCYFVKWEDFSSVETRKLHTADRGSAPIFTKWIVLKAKINTENVKICNQSVKSEKRKKFPPSEFLIRYTKKNAETLMIFFKHYRIDIWRDIMLNNCFG